MFVAYTGKFLRALEFFCLPYHISVRIKHMKHVSQSLDYLFLHLLHQSLPKYFRVYAQKLKDNIFLNLDLFIEISNRSEFLTVTESHCKFLLIWMFNKKVLLWMYSPVFNYSKGKRCLILLMEAIPSSGSHCLYQFHSVKDQLIAISEYLYTPCVAQIY